MSYRNNEFKIFLATPDESDELLKLFEDMDFSGDISIMFTRRPDAYQSLISEGEKVIIPIVKDITNDLICAMGCCIIRKAFINGQIKNVGYLTSLKIKKEYKSLLYLIKDVYRFLYENTKDYVDVYYTTILEDNKGAQRLLEKKRKNMPIYHYEGDYTVYCFAKSRYDLSIKNKNSDKYKLEIGKMKDVREFYKNNLTKYNFSPIDINLYQLHDDDFFILRDEKDDIVAACALWNQTAYKQYIITKYSGIFKYINKLPTNWLGYPKFPKENTPINFASVSLFLVKDMDAKIAEYFLRQVAQSDKKYNLLMLGLFETHVLNTIFNKIKHIKYKSRLYRVNWGDELLELDERLINIEVGLL